jgi:hypothetical protein
MQLAQEIVEEVETKQHPVTVTKGENGLTYAERQELKQLSQEVFGASSRWQKLVRKGYQKPITEEVTELVPGEKEGDEPTTKKVQVPLKRKDEAFQFTTERHTVESVKVLMLDLKVKLAQRSELIAKIVAEQKAQKEQEDVAKKLQEEAAGSAG